MEFKIGFPSYRLSRILAQRIEELLKASSIEYKAIRHDDRWEIQDDKHTYTFVPFNQLDHEP
jgi:hypothetical protein